MTDLTNNRIPEVSNSHSPKKAELVPKTRITGTKMRRGELAAALGVPYSTIKHYISLALLPYEQSAGQKYRRFDLVAVKERFDLINRLKSEGMTMNSIVRHFANTGLLEGKPDVWALGLTAAAPKHPITAAGGKHGA